MGKERLARKSGVSSLILGSQESFLRASFPDPREEGRSRRKENRGQQKIGKKVKNEGEK